MKRFFFFFLALIVSGCNTHSPEQSFIAGNFKYTSFTWRYNKIKASFELYVANYLSVDSNGKFIAMTHDDFMDSAKYFSGTISEALRREIDSVFSSGNYLRNYLFPFDTTAIYDGFTCSFDYQKKGSSRNIGLFIPELSPSRIRQLASTIDTLISKQIANKVHSFSIESYKGELQSKAMSAGIKIPKSVPPMVELRKPK